MLVCSREGLPCDSIYLFIACRMRLASGMSPPLGQDLVLETMVSCDLWLKMMSSERACLPLPSHGRVNRPVFHFPWTRSP